MYGLGAEDAELTSELSAHVVPPTAQCVQSQRTNGCAFVCAREREKGRVRVCETDWNVCQAGLNADVCGESSFEILKGALIQSSPENQIKEKKK